MLLGILSDTHNESARTQRAIEVLRAAGACVLIHCGDLSSAPIVSACSALPFYFVLGNHDADNVPELKNAAIEFGAICLGWGGVVELAGKKIGVVHGHLTTDLKQVLAEQPDYLLSGHAHFPVDTMQGTVRRINPGALFRAEAFTVALLNLKSDELRFLPVV
ncbi:MAG: metallophosphoesterase family protein [Planctomycetota bacterium]